jgi:hypothetical protein
MSTDIRANPWYLRKNINSRLPFVARRAKEGSFAVKSLNRPVFPAKLSCFN